MIGTSIERRAGEIRPPRRAVLFADPRGYRLARSRGWPGEAAALDAVRLLDTRASSAQIRELAGFFSLGPSTWAVVRGGCDAVHDDCRRYWREAVVVERADFARLRYNPFRLLPRRPQQFGDPPDIGLSPPELPPDATPADDAHRLAELRRPDGAAVSPDALETLLAAVLEAEQTLVLGSDLSYDDLEQLILLLPAPLRRFVTFHTHATGLPEPTPRLILTSDSAEVAFEEARFVLGHSLPATADRIARRSRRFARELIELSASPERLAAAHHGYEQYVARLRPRLRSLQVEVETLLRFARLRRARGAHVSEALRVLGEAIAARGTTAHQEPRWIFELIRLAYRPDAIGTAVAESLRVGDAGLVPAYVMERFALRRRKDAGEFAAFARRIEQLATELAASATGDAARRVRAMLLLLAAARGDAAGVVGALDVPLDAAFVRRLGGVDAWAPSDSPAVAGALDALVEADAPETVAPLLRALHALVPEVPHGSEQIRLVEHGLAYVRRAFRRLPPGRWPDAAALADAALELCIGVTAGSRVSLDGRPDTEHYRELLSRSMNPRALLELRGHTDAELFFGLLGADASRSRVSRREIGERGHVLVQAVHARIARDATRDDACPEGVHWSVALLDRVRTGTIDVEHMPLAIDLLQLSAPDTANAILRSYFDAYPSIAPLLLEHTNPREYLDILEFAALAAAALDTTLAHSIEARDLTPVTTLCTRLRQANVLLTAADLRPAVAPRLRALIDELREKATRPLAAYLQPLHRALVPILTPDAEQFVSALLLDTPEPAPTVARAARIAALAEAASSAAADPARARRLASAALAFLGIAFLGMAAVLLATERGRRALFGDGELTVANIAAIPDIRPAPPPPLDLAPEERLQQARDLAGTQAWSNVVALLLGDTLAPSAPAASAVAWDSLLALGALRMGERLEPGDIRRELLLSLTFNHAGRAMRAAPNRTSADYFRLLRAEACITGPLDCDRTVLNTELARVARSADPGFRERADSLRSARRQSS